MTAKSREPHLRRELDRLRVCLGRWRVVGILGVALSSGLLYLILS